MIFVLEMDEHHEISRRSFVSEAFEVGKQAKKAYDLLQGIGEWARNKTLSNEPRTEEEMEADCSIDLLSSPSDPAPVTRKMTYYMMALCLRTRPIMTVELGTLDDEASKRLITLELLKKDLEKRKTDRNYAIIIAGKSLYQITSVDKILALIPEDGEEVKVGEDMVLTVRIHRPTKHIENKLRIKWKMVRHDQQLLVLGRNKLSELRDAIKCPEDYVDLNVDPYSPLTFMNSDAPKKLFKEEYPSSFFFIHDTAYNDMRHPKSVDLSEPLRKWSKMEDTTGVEEIKFGKMEDTCLSDVTIRLGRPYLFNHANRCEHVIVFSMARQVEDDDPKPLSVYPLLTNVTLKRPKMCQMCREHVANFMVSETELVPVLPYFACKDCYLTYFFKDTKIQGRFTAHHYMDRTSVL